MIGFQIWLCKKFENLYQKIHFKILITVNFLRHIKQIKTKLGNFCEHQWKGVGRTKSQCFLKGHFFFSAGKNDELPGLTVSQTSLRSCKPTSPLSTAMCSPASICAKNLSNYPSSGKPYLIIFLCFALAVCSRCFLLIKQPADLSAKLSVPHCSKCFPNHICPIWPINLSLHCGTWTLELDLLSPAPGQGALSSQGCSS